MARVVVAEFNGVQNVGMHGYLIRTMRWVQKALMSADYLDARYRLLTSADDVCANDGIRTSTDGRKEDDARGDEAADKDADG